jgi:hypothetical protein
MVYPITIAMVCSVISFMACSITVIGLGLVFWLVARDLELLLFDFLNCHEMVFFSHHSSSLKLKGSFLHHHHRHLRHHQLIYHQHLLNHTHLRQYLLIHFLIKLYLLSIKFIVII